MNHRTRILFVFSVIAIIFCLVIHCEQAFIAHEGKNHDQDDHLAIFIDTDMGLDDVRALFALLGSPQMDIKGIITVEGSASRGRALDNLIGLAEICHKDAIPIFQGIACATGKAPPWRETADRLAGFPFPPPRRIKPQEAPFQKIISLIKNNEGEIHYLALGPLSNLARLERENPGILARLHTIWIPATIMDDGRTESWNLLYDIESTKTVFERAPRIIFLDTSDAATLDTCATFSSFNGSSYPASWIEQLFQNLCLEGTHLIVCDELVAASLIDMSISPVSDVAYRSRISDTITAERDTKGNLRRATLERLDTAVELLKNLWSTPLEIESEQHEHHATDSISVHDLIKRFHGHLGPYVVLGYRMGQIALERTGSEGHFNISADVHSMLKPPQSCLIDGVQLGSGCTLGKRNIEVHGTEGPAFAIFTMNDGRKITIKIRPEIPPIVSQLINERGVEATGTLLLEKDPDELFEIETSLSPEQSSGKEKK